MSKTYEDIRHTAIEPSPAEAQTKADFISQYQRLTDKKFASGLTDAEAVRLADLKREMDAADCDDPTVQERKRDVDQTYNTLLDLEHEIQDLIRSHS